MLQDYRSIRTALERGAYTFTFPWEKIGPLWILNQEALS